MAGVITLKFSVIKNGMAELGMKSPIFVPGPVQPQFGPGRMLFFEGFSVDEKGKQHYLDATIAYRQACLRTIEYLRRYGYDDYQIYLLLRYAGQAIRSCLSDVFRFGSVAHLSKATSPVL